MADLHSSVYYIGLRDSNYDNITQNRHFTRRFTWPIKTNKFLILFEIILKNACYYLRLLQWGPSFSIPIRYYLSRNEWFNFNSILQNAIIIYLIKIFKNIYPAMSNSVYVCRYTCVYVCRYVYVCGYVRADTIFCRRLRKRGWTDLLIQKTNITCHKNSK